MCFVNLGLTNQIDLTWLDLRGNEADKFGLLILQMMDIWTENHISKPTKTLRWRAKAAINVVRNFRVIRY